MKHFFKISILVLAVSAMTLSCEKDKKTEDPAPVTNPPASAEKGNLNIEFHNVVDDQTLELGKNYLNPSGESYIINKFNYYISNIILIKNDDSKLVISNKYQIIKQSDDTSRIIKLNGVPEGSYKSIILTLGLDSASNLSPKGVKTGGLDPAYASDMFWTWNQGYIFLKLEGTSPASASNSIAFHMGGASGKYKAQREMSIDFMSGNVAAVTKDKLQTIHLKVNVNEMFKSPNEISFADNAGTMSPGTKGVKTIADNYADMITFDSIK